MAGVKIVDLPALGRDLISTDLLEVSLNGSGSRKITGQEIMNASKLAIGSTPIVSGTVGRLLFQGAGNVLSQPSSLFYDAVNNRLGIGTTTPGASLDVVYESTFQSRIDMYGTLYMYNNITSLSGNIWLSNGYAIGDWGTGNNRIEFYSNRLSFFGNGNEALRIVGSTGNLLVNTTTDAGFKLDVNGTARATKVAIGAATSSPYQLNVWGGAIESYISLNNTNSGNATTDGFQIGLEPNGTDVYFLNRENGFIQFRTNNLDRLRIFSTGNVGINTTTDAGFRLDVNGDVRFAGRTFTGTGTILTPNQPHSVSDIVMKGDSALISANGNTGQWGKIVLCDSGAGTTYQNYSVGHFFRIGTTSPITYLSITQNQITTGASTRITMGAQDASDIYQATGANLYGSLLLFGNSGNTIFRNSYTLGTYQFFTAPSVDGTIVKQVQLFGSGNLLLQNGGTFTDVSSSRLTINSTTQGFLPPRMTNAQRAAIASPAVGLIVYCTDATEGLYVYKSIGWTFML